MLTVFLYTVFGDCTHALLIQALEFKYIINCVCLLHLYFQACKALGFFLHLPNVTFKNVLDVTPPLSLSGKSTVLPSHFLPSSSVKSKTTSHLYA